MGRCWGGGGGGYDITTDETDIGSIASLEVSKMVKLFHTCKDVLHD